MSENAVNTTQRHDSPALVIGFTIHGLAIARALAREGVSVHVLSDVGSPALPTTYTRYAKLHFRKGLNSGPLAEFLLELAQEIGGSQKIALFPTSDRIAKAIAASWDRLAARYLLSWSHCRDLVMELQRKDSLSRYCEIANVSYPRSRTLESANECEGIVDGLQFPLVVKPAQPLSSFKAIKVRSVAELRQCATDYPADFPFVVQEWIEGPEPSLYSCTTYLDRGRPQATLTSRKIAASPPGLGQGTVFETVSDARTTEIATHFLSQFDLSGPVAVEFKRDANGKFWLIEPNVGRTEYCVDLAIQSGFNLPYMEYLHIVTGSTERAVPSTLNECAWFDTDKDPACFLMNLGTARRQGHRRKLVFPFLGHNDRVPLAMSLWQQATRPFRAVGRRLIRMFRTVES